MKPGLAGYAEGDLRALAVGLIEGAVPSRAGDDWFERELCQGRTGDRGYNPGPEICHWLLWKLGCRDSRILSRTVPELNLKWTERGVERIVIGAERMAAWRPFRLGSTPKPGDIVHLGSAARGEPEHVCVFLSASDDRWTTADVLPCERKGHFQAAKVVRELRGERMVGRSGVTKRVNAWVDVFQVRYDVPPVSLP